MSMAGAAPSRAGKNAEKFSYSSVTLKALGILAILTPFLAATAAKLHQGTKRRGTRMRNEEREREAQKMN